MGTFTWNIDYGASQEEEPRVRRAQFGDGYSQRVTDGLNDNMPKWSVRVVSSPVTVEAARAFLAAQKGVTAFDWTPPNGTSGKYICSRWSRTIDDYGTATLSATFEMVPE
jgi:phage-related protein